MAFCVLLSTNCLAQVSGGSISGVLSDTSGARILHGEIVIRNTATGVTQTVTTNNTGTYTVPNLLPGPYSINASAPGFGTKSLSGITVVVGTPQVIDVSLGVSSNLERVVVSSSTQDIDRGTSDITGLVGGKTIRQLPLNGRSFSDLALLQPGVAAVQTQASFTTGADRGTRGFGAELTVAGARPQQNNYLLNGTSLNDYANGSGSVLGGNLGVDAIAEFTVITSNAPAEYGRSAGGIINAVTRSGTNRLHGSAYEFARNSVFDAKDPFVGPIDFSRNQFGAALGGPIIHDRTFFFTNYEGVRQRQGSSGIANVPSADARNGILHNADGSVTTIPVDPSVARYLAVYPQVNAGLLQDSNYAGGVNPNVGLYAFSTPQIANEDFVVGRIDHHFSASDSGFINYLFDRAPFTLPDSLNSLLVLSRTTRDVGTIEETHTFNTNLVNTFRIGVNRDVAINNVPAQALNAAAADPTLAAVPGQYAPQVIVPNLTLYIGGLNSSGTNYAWTSLQLGDDLFITRGLHSIKAGFAFEGMRLNEFTRSAINGQFQFTSLQNFLTNQPFIFDAATNPPTPRDLQDSLFAGYVQDDWRVTPSLTLNLGLRYETLSVVREAKGKLSNLVNLADPTPQLGNSYFKNPTRLNFEPRLGFSFSPFKNGETVLRGGFGVYDVLPLPYLFLLPAAVAAPYSEFGAVAGPGLPAGSFFSSAYGDLNPYVLTGAHVQHNPKRDYVYQYNLNIQHQLSRNLTLLIGYVGSRGIHQPYYSDQFNIVLPTLTPQGGYQWPTTTVAGVTTLNPGTPINPNYGAIRGLDWVADSYYNGLLVGLHQSLSHGIQYQVSYTQSRSIDDSSASLAADALSNSLAYLPFFAPARGRGPSDFNVGRVLVVNGIAELPHPHTSGRLISNLTGGWQLGSILTAHDGVPFTPTYGSDGDPLGSGGNGGIGVGVQDYPDRLNGPGCSGSLVNPGNRNNYVKNQCFGIPAVGLLGNVGRNSLTGPGVLELDGSLFKNIAVTRGENGLRIQLRAEVFNVLNHVNYANPTATDVFDSNNQPTSTSGQITGTTTPSREFQFGAKVLF